MARRETQYSRSPFAGILGLLVFVFLIYILSRMLIGAISLIWGIMAFIAPILIVLSLFLNFNVVKNFVGHIIGTYKKDVTRGILYTLGSVVGYPFVSLYLFYKALTSRRKQKDEEAKVKNKKKGEDYVDYEEVDDDEDFLVLDDLDIEEAQEEPLNRYDDLFNE